MPQYKWYLDTDENPYNNNSIILFSSIPQEPPRAALSRILPFPCPFPTTADGGFFLSRLRITSDNVSYREAYTSRRIAVLSPAVTASFRSRWSPHPRIPSARPSPCRPRHPRVPRRSFTGEIAARISDQDGNPLGTGAVAAGGLVKFLLTNLPPGRMPRQSRTLATPITAAATSSAFTLRINPAAATKGCRFLRTVPSTEKHSRSPPMWPPLEACYRMRASLRTLADADGHRERWWPILPS